YGVHIPWWAFLIAACSVTGAAGYRGIVASVRVLAVAGALEILIVVALAAWGVARPGPGGAALSPFVSGVPGGSALLLAVVFSIAAFSGWEAAAPLAEESE